jgi:hypothetical protein
MKPIHPERWMPIGKHANYLAIDKNCNRCKRSKECQCVNDISIDQVNMQVEAYYPMALNRKYAEY